MNGPRIMFTIPVLGGIPVTETITTTWLIILLLSCFAYFGTRNFEKLPKGLQNFVELIVDAVNKLVKQTMGEDKVGFAPYIGSIFLFLICANLVGLLGIRPPTADLNTTVGMALITFILVQFNGIRVKGLKGYLKGFLDPLPFLLPLNVIGELANPISLSFRLFGNIAGGMVITTLLYGFLSFLTTRFIGISIPILQVGIPAVLHIYFDLFTGVLQAFIFVMLTMVFISMAMD
ncbi:ATP synthase F0 subcomplex A subunit [Alkalithermobacter thermoalcaliphilus JW-YL-7 = DSM 7308]|uniref:ATP synthase subunit a n=2 Tax=Clostridium paradoxum TaxID=29346 RepID=A0A150FSH2_CLOPD|nr:ATP synthase subunit a [[Clostridium] paradoxum] [[Clostridium] paradoxum JW-YL-7 = DSM 7308]KXZ40528.1 ATP synthase subunit a [[Clostridium] paradoxum JW-YL-7 = DSM 7308]SHK71829.1 ATP synthase F0 subcomplex A subunit [[Clostridium] paradoxum JW-YL-7 = DSM 7308]